MSIATEHIERNVAQLLRSWRQHILDAIYIIATLLSSIVLVSNLVDSNFFATVRFTNLQIAAFIIYAVLLVLAVLRRLSYLLRTTVLLSLIYLVGVLIVLDSGVMNSSRIFFLFGIVLSAIFLGWRSALVYLVLVLGSFATIGLLITNQSWVPPSISQTTTFLPATWFTPLFIVVLVALTLIWAINYLFDRLIESLKQASLQADRANNHALESEQQRQQLAEQTTQLAATETMLRQVVSELETPAVALADGVLLTPLVGHLDQQRLKLITTRLLQHVTQQRTSHVIIDLAGVPQLNQVNALALIETIQALRLLGCQVALTGIAPSIALTLTNQNVQLPNIQIAATPQDVLASLARINSH